MPEIKVYETLANSSEYRKIQQQPHETLQAALRREGIRMNLPCGGNGTCGTCRFLLLTGETVVTEEERRLLSAEQIENGERLLCRASFVTDGSMCLSVKQTQPATGTDALIASAGITAALPVKAAADIALQADGFAFAVDIGTTTIAMALVDTQSGKITASLTKNNSQRRWGADVLSRIQKANEGEAESLRALIWNDLSEGMEQLLKGAHGQPKQMVVSANTTMEHLLLGDSCEGLGKAPFVPVNLALRTMRIHEVWEQAPGFCRNMKLTILPGISAFVGADIVSGMYDCAFYEAQEPILLLDLGTNGEMVLGTKMGFLATATAAGPAFEGGNITCGCPGVPGAICGVSMMGGRIVTQTVGNKKPVGICGTGILELTYELYKTGIMDEKGNLQEAYLKSGYPVAEMENGDTIVYTQGDIRQLQMAKAAVRSGIELLCAESEIELGAIGRVCLAGGLGYKLNVHKAAGIGLIPQELRNKTTAVGNTSLQGALRYLLDAHAAEEMEFMQTKTKEMNLAAHPLFETYYLKYMNFDA